MHLIASHDPGSGGGTPSSDRRSGRPGGLAAYDCLASIRDHPARLIQYLIDLILFVAPAKPWVAPGRVAV